MASLPSFFVLQYGGRYLSVINNILGSTLPSGFLKFDEKDVRNPRIKFAVEPAQTGNGRLVHIRCCYNNKYLVAKQIQMSLWIVASAKKPEEDQSKGTCTLFEPYSLPSERTSVRLRISATQSPITYGNTQQGMLVYSTGSPFRAIDWDTLIILPSRVAFKSEDLKDHYLCSRRLNPRWPYQRFETGFDIGDPLVAKELFPTDDGNYRIKDLYFGKFWRRSPNWIWADAEYDDNSKDTLFSIVKINDKVFGLRNLGNNYFCGALTTERKTNCLNAQYPNLVKQTRLMIEETVLERKIKGIKYRLSDSRIYKEEIKGVDHAFATNNKPYKDDEVVVHFSKSDSKTTSWNNSVSLKFGGKVSFKVDAVPVITSVGVELSAEVDYTHEWGGTVTKGSDRGASYAVPVPPFTKMMVTQMCTKSSCDVPFSYTQTDLLPSGGWADTPKDDGIFTSSSYNYYYESSVAEVTDPGNFVTGAEEANPENFMTRGMCYLL